MNSYYMSYSAVCFKAGRWNNGHVWNRKEQQKIFYKVFTWINHASQALQEQAYDSEPANRRIYTKCSTCKLKTKKSDTNTANIRVWVGEKILETVTWSGQQVVYPVSSLKCLFLLSFVSDEWHVCPPRRSVIRSLARGKKRTLCLCLDWSRAVG